MEKMGVYRIVNRISGKFYVGSSVHLFRRKSEHFSRLRRHTHCNLFLQKAFDKYGENAFSFEIIEIVDDVDQLMEREQYWLDKLKPYNREIGYNINQSSIGPDLHGENNPMYGVSPQKRMDEKTYEKWLASRQGENASRPMQGKKHTIESREKMRIKALGRKHTEEWKQQHSKDLAGRKMSDIQREHISEAKLRGTSKNDVPVICLDTGVTYRTLSAAAREYGVSKNAIFNAITGKSKTCKGLRWTYCEKESKK